MASADRSEEDRLRFYRALQKDPTRFGFFAALRRIEALNPNKARIGTSVKPGDDPVRFGQEPSMSFAPSTLASFSMADSLARAGAPRMDVLFFGVFGPNGPLPLHLTEYARERIRNEGDRTFADFIDLFHHRLLSFFYRAWSEASPSSQLDRPEVDHFAPRLGALQSIGVRESRSRDAAPDFAKLHYTGRLSNQSRNAEGLLELLRHFFTVPIAIEQYIGTWFHIPEGDRFRLGDSPETGSLGLTTSVGERVWECQSKFRLRVGPVSLAEYQRMLPGGASLVRLVAWVRNYLGDELDWDVQLILHRDEVKTASLGSFGQLGWSTWLEGPLPQTDPDQLFLNPMQDLL